MLKLPFGKSQFQKTTVVVEIGNDWLKVAEYTPSSSGGAVTKLGLQKLASVKDNISVAVSKIFKDLSLGRDGVVLCIPRHLITVRVLDLPSTDAKEINDMINLQIGKQTPYSKEEIVSAHRTIYSSKEGYTKVVLAIAHRGIINARIDTLKSAEITVGKVLISSEGVYNWFSLSYIKDNKSSDAETTALLDIDSNYSDFIAIRSGKPVFTKNIFLGANHFADRQDLWRDKLVEELKRCVKRYYTEEKNTSITKLYLSGAVNAEGIDTILANSLDMPCEKTDTFRVVSIKGDIRAAEGQNMKFVSLTPLIGTAVKNTATELDLMPLEQKISKLMDKKRKELMILGILFVSIVTAFSFFLAVNFSYKGMYLAQLKKKLTDVSGESGEIDKMRMGIELARHALDAKKSSLNILHEIYRITPSEISLTSIDIDEEKQVVLKGRGFTMSDVFKFIKKLEESLIFENVKASYTRTRKEKENDKELEYVEFEIVCPYEKGR